MRINYLKSAILFFIWSFTTNVVAQTPKIDSLKINLQNHSESDTTRVHLLNALAFSYFTSDIPKAIEYLEEADSIAEITSFKKGKARSIYIKGITEAVQSNFEQALKYYNEALKLYENIDFKKGVANSYNAMGITFKNKGELRKSIVHFEKAIKIEEQIKSDNLSASLLNLGTSYSVLGEFDKAILYLKKSLSIAKADKNQQRVAYSLNNLGTVYSDQGNYPLAQEYFKESLYINERLGDSLGIANHLTNIGQIYMYQKDYDKAMSYFTKSFEINKRINRKIGVSGVLNYIGKIHEEKGDYRIALDHYTEALDIIIQIGAKSETPDILNSIGGVYLALKDFKAANQYYMRAKKISIETESKLALCESYIGLANTYVNQKRYNSALSNVLKAKDMSKKFGFLDYQKEASEILSKIYEATGNYKKAFSSYKQFKILNDSLFNKENIEKIAQLEYEYKYKQALDSASIRELTLTRTVKTTSQNLEKSQRNLLLGVITFLVMTLVLGGIIFSLKFRNVKTKTQNIIIEQKLLRSQMTPHFIFNSLSVLQGMILNKEEKQSISYLSRFSKLLRTILENSRYKTVALSEELSAIDSYMTLQNLDVDPPYEYSLTVATGIDQATLKIPPMLIQPFIENAIEHAFPNRKDHKVIKVTITFKGKKLVCTIEDNGIGFDPDKPNAKKEKQSLATTITSERLEILSKEFNTEGSVNIENKASFNKQGTLITLVIPYIKT